MRNYYEILKLEPRATLEEIHSKYRFLVKVFHPDRFQDEESKKEAETELKLINEAYNTLSNQEKRRVYDIKIGVQAQPDENPHYSDTSKSDEAREFEKALDYFSYLLDKWDHLLKTVQNENRFERIMESFIISMAPFVDTLGEEIVKKEVLLPLLWFVFVNVAIGAEKVTNEIPKYLDSEKLWIYSSIQLDLAIKYLFSLAEKKNPIFDQRYQIRQADFYDEFLAMSKKASEIGEVDVRNIKSNNNNFSGSNTGSRIPNPPTPNINNAMHSGSNKNNRACIWIIIILVAIYGCIRLISVNNSNQINTRDIQPTNTSWPTVAKSYPTATNYTSPTDSCISWENITTASKGEFLCVKGIVKNTSQGIDGVFHIYFSDNPAGFRLIVSNGYFKDSLINKCVSASGILDTYGKMPFIKIQSISVYQFTTYCQ
jgi:curved DNA-binding protein CbpA